MTGRRQRPGPIWAPQVPCLSQQGGGAGETAPSGLTQQWSHGARSASLRGVARSRRLEAPVPAGRLGQEDRVAVSMSKCRLRTRLRVSPGRAGPFGRLGRGGPFGRPGGPGPCTGRRGGPGRWLRLSVLCTGAFWWEQMRRAGPWQQDRDQGRDGRDDRRHRPEHRGHDRYRCPAGDYRRAECGPNWEGGHPAQEDRDREDGEGAGQYGAPTGAGHLHSWLPLDMRLMRRRRRRFRPDGRRGMSFPTTSPLWCSRRSGVHP